MNEEIERVYAAFDGKLIGTWEMKVQVCDVLSKMPEGTINFVTKKCWFLSSMPETWAFAFTGNDLKDMHLIFLSDDLLAQETEQVQYTIAHEIGHIVLEHRNSTLVKQTKAEIDQQEREADEFAKQFIQP